MNIAIPKNIKELRKYLNDPLYKNSYFPMATTVIGSILGFFFWMLANFSFTKKPLLKKPLFFLSTGSFSKRKCFDFSLIRFLPINDKSKVFNTCLIITTIASFIVGIIYISGVSFFSSSLSFIQNPCYAIIFLTFAVMNSITMITGFAFITLRKDEHYFW